MSGIEKKRKQWIDIAKGIGIILVVLGHVTKNRILIRIIYSFHMPLFFFLSGYLINKNCGARIFDIHYIKNKFIQLILPFCEYRIILVVYWLLIERQFRELDVGPIWFLPVMFFTYIMISIILPYLKKLKYKCFLLISFILLLFVGLSFRSYFYNLNETLLNELYVSAIRVLAGCSWMIIGMIAQDVYIYLKTINYKVVLILAAIICLSLSIVNGDISLFNLQFGKSYLLYYLEGISGIVTVIILSKVLGTNDLLEYLGKSSMIVMAFHEPIKRIIFKVYDILTLKFVAGGSTHEAIRSTVVGSIIMTIITLLVCIGMIYLVRKIIERLPDKKWKEILFAFMR